MKKFVRRNRVLVGGIAAVIVVLVAGVAVSTILAIGQTRALTENKLISDFLIDVLGSAKEARAGEATVSFTLDFSSPKLKEKFKDKPLIEAKLHRTFSETYRVLGEPEKAEQHQLRAIEIYRQLYGEEHPDTLGASSLIGYIYEKQGRYHDMERLGDRILEIQQRISSVEDQINTMNWLAITYCYLGKYKQAESLYDKTLDLVRKELGEEKYFLLPYIKCNLARVYGAQGRYDEAEQLFCGTMEAAGWDAESHGSCTAELANIYRDWGRHDKAEPLFDEALEALRQIKGDENYFTVQWIYDLVRLYVDQDRYEEAQTLFSEAMPIVRQIVREEHPLTLGFVNAYAVFLRKQKQYNQAETLFDEALKGRQRELGDDHPDTLESKNDLAVLYKEQGDYAKAEPLFIEALEGRRLKLGDTHPHTLKSINNLIDLYEAWNKTEKANQWRAKLPQPTPTR